MTIKSKLSSILLDSLITYDQVKPVKVCDQYSVKCTSLSPTFWKLADLFQNAYKQNKPVSSGLFDLNRYQNRQALLVATQRFHYLLPSAMLGNYRNKSNEVI